VDGSKAGSSSTNAASRTLTKSRRWWTKSAA
ncbi:MAG: hypothetical protein AVDCRST_MAG51-1173, partial [uncultured Ramlibacter sp.]